MRKEILWKLLAAIGLTVLATLPLAMVRGVIMERHVMRGAVVNSIEKESVGTQALYGPVLVVPYDKLAVETHREERGKQEVEVKRKTRSSGMLFFLPERVDVDGTADVEERRRGIYKAQAFGGTWTVRGRFELPRDFGGAAGEAHYEFGRPRVGFGIGDVRGLAPDARLTWQGEAVLLQPGSAVPGLGPGIHAELRSVDARAVTPQAADFELKVSLSGLNRMQFFPLGRVSTVNLVSSWPHPGFFGPLLGRHAIDEDGFRVTWRTSFLASNAREVFSRCFEKTACEPLQDSAFGVNLIEPVNLYLQLERSAKHGLLFVGLTFAAFFLFDVLKRHPIHPVQYTLVGGALVIFYLLVTSLSEHVGFGLAYLAAASGCVSLIGYYVAHVLHSWRRGAAAAGMIGSLYGVLYVILRSEDNALLMGSLLLFALMAATMVATRRIDWYQVGAGTLGEKAARG